MGGCRCIFRNCEVSTARNPEMHFFHFPVKNKPLHMKWVKMAGVESLLQQPETQQRNRVICGRHFREECFMNYKKNRLVSNNPVPTLMRLNRTLALDYAQCYADGTPCVIELEKTKLPHLIPPPGYKCTLGLNDDEVVAGDINLISVGEREVEIGIPHPVQLENEIHVLNGGEEKECSINMPETYVKKSLLIKNDMENTKKRFTAASELPTSKKIKIINGEYARAAATSSSTTLTSTLSLAVMQQQTQLQANSVDCDDDITCDEESLIEIQEYTVDEVENNEEQDFVSYNKNETEENAAECLHLQQQLDEERNNHCATVNNMEKVKLSLQTANQRLRATLLELETKNVELEKLTDANLKLTLKNQELRQTNTQIDSERETLRTKCEQWDAMFGQLQETYALLQEKCTKLETEKQKVIAISTSKELLPTAAASSKNSISSTSSILTSAQSLTKAQLFNGIKKYLSSSMTALVRMEMFGNAERDWKTDERRVAVDLLQLGEQVYTYFTDEWRFRLPALRQAHVWLNETIVEDEENL